MDPNAARSKMIEQANTILGLINVRQGIPPALLENHSTQLAEAVHDLDEWLRSGGFLPDAWLVRDAAGEQPGRRQDVDISVDESLVRSKEVDDDRPRRDGGVCGHDVWSEPHMSQVPCILDRGHEGDHVPV